MSKNTFGKYKFESWVPKHTQEIIKNFWGQMGRTHKDWLENIKFGEREFCFHGPNPDGFGNPPNGAKATYFIRNKEIYTPVTGRYLHRWNNMGSLIDDKGEDHTVSSCDYWVRIFMTQEERSAIINPQQTGESKK